MCQRNEAGDLPGITFQALARARKQLMLTELVGRGQRELSDAMHISPASVAVSLKSLERGGYVEKLPGEADQRRKAVRLTDKGRAALAACHQIFREVDRRMFGGFTPEEMEQVRAFQLRMLHNLRGALPTERMNGTC